MPLAVLQLRMKVESKVTTIADAIVSGLAIASFRSASPIFKEKRSDRAPPVVLHMANSATLSAIRAPNGVASGLRGDDLLLEACQHSLRLSEG
jgi:hypothetical protein